MHALLSTLILAVMAVTPSDSNISSIRTMPVARTPESSTIILRIAIPQDGELVGSPTWIQFRIDGFALGAPSQFGRASEIVQTDMGQTVHVVIDNKPYFPINEPALDPFDEGGYFYDMSYKFEVPDRLDPGMHTIRMFPARSFGESLKGENTFAAINFYVGKEKNKPGRDLSLPYITYNEPSDQLPLSANQPVLLDFYVTNAELSPDGYKVRLTIDGKTNRTITSWQPYYIYGLTSGKHTIRLELLDKENKPVAGEFNDVTQTIYIK
ncbi:MAG: hypothetical protein WCF19_08370 [Chlamydiales bacterium]